MNGGRESKVFREQRCGHVGVSSAQSPPFPHDLRCSFHTRPCMCSRVDDNYPEEHERMHLMETVMAGYEARKQKAALR
jgi:hypothetical protein